LTMSSGWKQLNVKVSHKRNHGRNTRRG
jgi:hypothetical protein